MYNIARHTLYCNSLLSKIARESMTYSLPHTKCPPSILHIGLQQWCFNCMRLRVYLLHRYQLLTKYSSGSTILCRRAVIFSQKSILTEENAHSYCNGHASTSKQAGVIQTGTSDIEPVSRRLSRCSSSGVPTADRYCPLKTK